VICGKIETRAGISWQNAPPLKAGTHEVTILLELWDVYDVEGNLLEGTLIRDERIPRGQYHLVVEVLTLTPDGRMLITQRAPGKTFPLQWEVTGGSALKGEDAKTGAVRELREETGIQVTPAELLPVAAFTIRDCHFRTFAVVKDVLPADIILQPTETVAFRFVEPAAFRAMCLSGEIAAPIAERCEEYLEIRANVLGMYV